VIVQYWRARSVGEVSEACHNERIRHELSVPSAESSCGVRRGVEWEESYHLGRGMIVSTTREMSARAKSEVEKSSKCGSQNQKQPLFIGTGRSLGR